MARSQPLWESLRPVNAPKAAIPTIWESSNAPKTCELASQPRYLSTGADSSSSNVLPKASGLRRSPSRRISRRSSTSEVVSWRYAMVLDSAGRVRSASGSQKQGDEMKASYNGVAMPADGKAIGYANGVLQVPDNPIIPFIEGDGTGRDIWKASRRVFDAAVEKAYGGKRRV